jgi:hypothetical protein
VGEWGSVFSSPAAETCGTEKDAVGDVTSHTFPASLVCTAGEAAGSDAGIFAAYTVRTIAANGASKNHDKFLAEVIFAE